jgi:hypothetical protein
MQRNAEILFVRYLDQRFGQKFFHQGVGGRRAGRVDMIALESGEPIPADLFAHELRVRVRRHQHLRAAVGIPSRLGGAGAADHGKIALEWKRQEERIHVTTGRNPFGQAAEICQSHLVGRLG